MIKNFDETPATNRLGTESLSTKLAEILLEIRCLITAQEKLETEKHEVQLINDDLVKGLDTSVLELENLEGCFLLPNQEKDLSTKLAQRQYDQLHDRFLTSERDAIQLLNQELNNKVMEMQKFEVSVMAQLSEECCIARETIQKLESEAKALVSKKIETEKFASELEVKIDSLLEDSRSLENKMQDLLLKMSVEAEHDMEELSLKVQQSSLPATRLPLLVSDPIHHSKRLKQSSTAPTRPETSSNYNFDDLPDDVLMEILCRLPSYKFVAQCKCVFKRFSTLLSDPSFLRSIKNSRQMVKTLVNTNGEEFLDRMPFAVKPLSLLFNRLMRAHKLEREPFVVGAYNDLVLCCSSLEYQRDYYICNPFTLHWSSLPPPPAVHRFTPVGFIYKEGVGRVLRLKHRKICCKFVVEVFSTDTGEWTQSIVSSSCDGSINELISFVCYGVLFWMSFDGELIVGLDPFMISDSYQCQVLRMEHPEHHYDQDAFTDPSPLYCLGECEQQLSLLHISTYNQDHCVLTIWKVNPRLSSSGSAALNIAWRAVNGSGRTIRVLGFDPNAADSMLYLAVSLFLEDTHFDHIWKYDIQNGLCSVIAAREIPCPFFYPLEVPYIPTPVPGIGCF